ncbi:MAG: TRAP transporter substrate-binding protein DctP [Verrucomicrobiota bacterium]
MSIFALAALSLGGTVRLATLVPKDSSFDKSLKRMGQSWREATDGEDRLLVYASGQQGSESAMIKKMEINRLHAALLSGVGLAEIDQSIAVLQQVPLLYRNYDELEHVMEKMAPVFEERIQAKGFVVLGWLDTGWVRIFSKNKLLTPDDMRKSKLFTWAGDAPQTSMLKKMGFRPVPIESTEINSSMSTGLIDTVPMPPFYALASQIYNPAPYMLDFNYAPMVGAVIVNKKTWDGYTPDQQSKIRAAAEEAALEMKESGRAESVESIRVMRDDWNLKVSALTPETREQWQAISKEAYVHIRDNTVPADIWDKVVAILEEYRATKG